PPRAALPGCRAPGAVGRERPPRPPHLVRQLRALSRRRCGPSRKTVAAQAPGTTSTTSRGVRPATLAESHADRLPRARAPGVAPSRHADRRVAPVPRGQAPRSSDPIGLRRRPRLVPGVEARPLAELTRLLLRPARRPGGGAGFADHGYPQ